MVAEDIPVNLCRSVLLRPCVNQQFPELFVANNHASDTFYHLYFLNEKNYIISAPVKKEVIFLEFSHVSS